MYEKLINLIKTEPKLYETTGLPFWDDPHISKYMLKAHLDEKLNSASRNLNNIKKSVRWISSLPMPIKTVLDLGCGPGLYAEEFDEKGYRVTGIDFSKRSITYAKESAKNKRKHIKYIYGDYLTMNYKEEFDLVVLIYCDFGVLPPEDRSVLLRKIYQALKPGGSFVMDAFTPNYYKNFKDATDIKYVENGFWLPEPHLCVTRNKRYEKEHFLEQYFIITDNDIKTYNIWNHAYSRDKILTEFMSAGFEKINIYGDVVGNPYSADGDTLCTVAKKL